MVITWTAAGLVFILLFTHGVCSQKITCSVVFGCEGCTHFTCYTGPVSWSSLSVETLKPVRAPIAECSRSTKHEPHCTYFTEVCNNLTASIQNEALSLCLLQGARGTVYQCQIPGDQYQSISCKMDSGTVSSQGPVLPGTSDSEAAGDTTPQIELSSDKADWKTRTIILGCIIGVVILLVFGYLSVRKILILSKKNTSNDFERVTVVSPSTVPPAPDSTPCHDTTGQHTQAQATANEAAAISSNQPRTPTRSVEQADLPRTWGSSVTSVPYQQEEAGLLPSGASTALTIELSAAAYEVNESEEEDLKDFSRGYPGLLAVEIRSLLDHETTNSSKLGHLLATHLATETQDL